MNQSKQGGSGSNTAKQKQQQLHEVLSSEQLMSNQDGFLSPTSAQQHKQINSLFNINNNPRVSPILPFSQQPLSPHFSYPNSPITSQTQIFQANAQNRQQSNLQGDLQSQFKPAESGNTLKIVSTLSPKHADFQKQKGQNMTVQGIQENLLLPMNLTQTNPMSEDKAAMALSINSNNNLLENGFSKWNMPNTETEQNMNFTEPQNEFTDNYLIADHAIGGEAADQNKQITSGKSKIMTQNMRNKLKNKQNMLKGTQFQGDNKDNNGQQLENKNQPAKKLESASNLFNMTESIRINANNKTNNSQTHPLYQTASFKVTSSNPLQVLQTKGSMGSNISYSNNYNNFNSNAKIYPESRQIQTRAKQASVFSQQSFQTRLDDENNPMNNALLDSNKTNINVIPKKIENNITLKIPSRPTLGVSQSQNNTPQSKQNAQINYKSPPEINIPGVAASQSPQKINKQSRQVLQKSKSHHGFFSFFNRFFSKASHSNLPSTPHSPTNNNIVNAMSNSILTQDNNKGLSLNPQASNSIQQGSNGNIPQPNTEINPGTNWNFVKKLAKVKKFIDSIKTSNLYQSFYKVKATHLSLIDDKADYSQILIDGNEAQSSNNNNPNPHQTSASLRIVNPALTVIGHFFLNFWNYLEEKIQQIPAFLPHQPLLNLFKITMLLVSVITLVIAPLVGCFDLTITESSAEHFLFFLVPCILFAIEIIISLNTAYYEEGDVQTNRAKIIKQYVKHALFLDVPTVISLYLLMVNRNPVFVLLVMLKIFKIPAYRRDINEYFYIQQRANTMYTLVNLILSVMIVAHYIACGFNYIAAVEENTYNVESWVLQLNLDANSWISRYINAIYFSFITMVTVGFGDIKPMTDAEKIYVTLVALSSSLIFAYTVNTIGTVFQEIAQQEAEYKSQKYHLSMYMRSRSINQRLQARAMKYLDHMIHKQLESPQKGQEILKKMPNKVRDEIYKDFFGKILQDSKMFKFNFSEPFLKELTVQMKEIICRPGEVVFSLNETDNRIFFINKGEVELFLEKNKKKDEQDIYSFDVLSKGDIFGEQSFFTSKIRENSAKSLSVSHLIYCTYEDFASVIRQFPKDYEKFCQMKDEVMNYGEQLSTRCAVCSKFRHSIVNCPYLHLIRRPENVIHRHIRSIPNERSKHFRSKQAKINTLEINFKVRTKLRKLRREYVSKASKKLKEDSVIDGDNANSNSNKNGQYQINVKPMQDSDDEIIETETLEELKKLSDRKFLRSMPKIEFDIPLNSVILRNQEEEEEIMEEIEEDEYFLEEEDEEEDQVIEDQYGMQDQIEQEEDTFEEGGEGEGEEQIDGEDKDEENEDDDEDDNQNDDQNKIADIQISDIQNPVTKVQYENKQQNNNKISDTSISSNQHIKQTEKIMTKNGLSIVISQVDIDEESAVNAPSNNPIETVNLSENNHRQEEFNDCKQLEEKLESQANSQSLDLNDSDKPQGGDTQKPIDKTDRTHIQSHITSDSTTLKKLKSLDEKFDLEFMNSRKDNNINQNNRNRNDCSSSRQKIICQSVDSIYSLPGQDLQSNSLLTDRKNIHLNSDQDSYQDARDSSQKKKQYKQKNRLVFKNSVFSLKLADLASQVKLKGIQHQASLDSPEQGHLSILELKSLNGSFSMSKDNPNNHRSSKSVQIPTTSNYHHNKQQNNNSNNSIAINQMAASSPLEISHQHQSPEHRNSLSKPKSTKVHKRQSEQFISLQKQLKYHEQQPFDIPKQELSDHASSRSSSAGAKERKKYIKQESININKSKMSKNENSEKSSEKKKIKVVPFNIGTIPDANGALSPELQDFPKRKITLKYSTPTHSSSRNIYEPQLSNFNDQDTQQPFGRRRADKKNRLSSMMIPSSSQNDTLLNYPSSNQIGVNSPFYINSNNNSHLQVPNSAGTNNSNLIDPKKRFSGQQNQNNNTNNSILSSKTKSALNSGSQQSVTSTGLKKISLLNPHHDFSTAWQTNQLTIPSNTNIFFNSPDAQTSSSAQQSQSSQQMHLLNVPIQTNQSFGQYMDNTNSIKATSPMAPPLLPSISISAATPASTSRSIKKQLTAVHHAQPVNPGALSGLFFPGTNTSRGGIFSQTPLPSPNLSPNAFQPNMAMNNNSTISNGNNSNMTFNQNNNLNGGFNINNSNNGNYNNNFSLQLQQQQQQLMNGQQQQQQQQLSQQQSLQIPSGQQPLSLLNSYQLQQQQQQLLQQIQQLTQLQHFGSISAPQHLHSLLGNFNTSNIDNTNIPSTNNNNNINNLAEEAYVAEYRSHKMLFLYDFDRLKEFTNYFPHNNYSIVCKEKKKIVIRKNLFAVKRIMGSSSRNIMFKQTSTNCPASHPSPRGAMHPSLLMSGNSNNPNIAHSYNGSFRGGNTQGNKLFSAVLQASPHLGLFNLPIPGENQPDQPVLERSKSKLKKAAESLLNSKHDSLKSLKRPMRLDQNGNNNNLNISDFQGNALNPFNKNQINGNNSRISSFANICNTYTEIKDISPPSHNLKDNMAKSTDDGQAARAGNILSPPELNGVDNNNNNIFNFRPNEQVLQSKPQNSIELSHLPLPVTSRIFGKADSLEQKQNVTQTIPSLIVFEPLQKN